MKVTFAAGTLGLMPLPNVPKAMLQTPGGQPGVQVEYFGNPKREFGGKPLAVQTEDGFYIDKSPAIEGLPKDLQWSARYTASFTPARSGVQKFTLYGSGSARLFVGDRLIGEYLRADFTDTVYANVQMTAGQAVPIRVEFTPRESFGNAARDQFDLKLGVYTALGWSGPDDLIEQAVQAAKGSDVAVVFVGHRIGEGMDRLSLGLPNDQDALIEAVAKANPHTVVVLNTGGAVTMPWLGEVAAVLEMWLPGDAYGTAASRLLFGDAEPGGRLPVTFPKDETQGPATKASQYPGTLYEDGSVDTTHFDEGIFVGYRYWDQYRQDPLFAFGYGLSYTTFSTKGLGVTKEPGAVTMNVAVKNTGTRRGSEVVQVYLGFPAAAGEPPRQLKGMQKVTLNPGEEQTVHVRLDGEAFQYWDEARNAWTTAPGGYQVMAGRSSREIFFLYGGGYGSDRREIAYWRSPYAHICRDRHGFFVGRDAFPRGGYGGQLYDLVRSCRLYRRLGGFVGWMGGIRVLHPSECGDHFGGTVPGILTRSGGVAGGDSGEPAVAGGLSKPAQFGTGDCR